MKLKVLFWKRVVGQKLFLLVFLLVFIFSGAFSLLTIRSGGSNFKLGISMSIISFFILLLLGIKVDRIAVLVGVLTIIGFLSGLINQSTPDQVIYFLRKVVYFFLTYSVVQICVTSKNIKQVIIWVVRVAIIQLPLLIIQKVIYPYLPSVIHARITAIDFGTGSFNIHSDAAMCFFIILVIVYLLFEPKQNYFIKGKWFILAWLTLTIFIAESELLKLLVITIWLVFFIVKLRNPKVIIFLFMLLILVISLAPFGVFNSTIEVLSERVKSSLDTSPEAIERFLSGGYARGAALKYYLSKGIFLLGDGPSNYFDIETNQILVGNRGHFFGFYSEVGQLGLLCSLIILTQIAFPYKNGVFWFSWANLLKFTSILVLTLTTSIMDNFAVLLIYCIMSSTYLIPKLQPNHGDYIVGTIKELKTN